MSKIINFCLHFLLIRNFHTVRNVPLNHLLQPLTWFLKRGDNCISVGWGGAVASPISVVRIIPGCNRYPVENCLLIFGNKEAKGSPRKTTGDI